jgi:hypothetical protein
MQKPMWLSEALSGKAVSSKCSPKVAKKVDHSLLNRPLGDIYLEKPPLMDWNTPAGNCPADANYTPTSRDIDSKLDSMTTDVTFCHYNTENPCIRRCNLQSPVLTRDCY